MRFAVLGRRTLSILKSFATRVKAAFGMPSGMVSSHDACGVSRRAVLVAAVELGGD